MKISKDSWKSQKELKRLFFDETEGKVRYQYSRQGPQEESMDYLEFIARVISHIPDKGAERPPPPHIVQKEPPMAAKEQREYF